MYIYDGATIVGSVDISNWGAGLSSIWFSASNVITKGLVWGSAYTLKLQSKPPYVLTTISHNMASNEYVSGSVSTVRSLLGTYILARIAVIEAFEGTTLTVITISGKVLNTEGTSLVLDAVPGVGTILNIFQTSISIVDVGRHSHNETYQETLSSYKLLASADDSDYWYGTSPNLTWDRVQGNYAMQDVIAYPTIGGSYNLTYDPPGVWDITDYASLEVSIKCSRYAVNFTSVRVYLEDVAGNMVFWTLPFAQNKWTTIETDNLTGEVGGSSYNKAITDNVTFMFVTSDGGGYSVIVDDIKVWKLPNITVTGFRGVAEWLQISPTILATVFFGFVYIISSSVIYMVTGNGIGALALAVPILLVAAYPLGLIPLAFIFVMALTVFVVFAYYFFLR